MKQRKKMKYLKKIPKFKTEKEEVNFWATHDSTDYIDWQKAKTTIFPNLSYSSRAVPIKLPNWLIDRLKYLANKYNTSYQALLRSFVATEVQKELKSIKGSHI